MAKVALVFALLLVVLGLAGFLGTGSVHYTALIPTWFGLALGVFGFLAISPSEGRRKLFMHINVTIGAARIPWRCDRSRARLREREFGRTSAGHAIALASKVAMAGLMLIYVILCVRSFIAARRSGKV
jgi:steroid 5-alpha reductase family enzyme